MQRTLTFCIICRLFCAFTYLEREYAMFRRFSALSLIVLFALAFAPAYAQQATPAATANTIVVTNLNPNGPGSLDDAFGRVLPGGTITFAPGLKGTIPFGGADLSYLGKGFAIVGTGLKSTDLVLSGGLGFRLHAPYTLTLENLALAHTGGIEVFGGTVNINNVTFQGNAFLSGGAIGSNGTVHITNSLFQGNTTTSGDGAAIENNGEMTIANSTFQGNVGTSAIYNNGHITIINSTFSGNSIGPNNLVLPTLEVVRPGDIILKGTIIDGVSGGPLCAGKIIDGGGNLQFPTNECGTSIPVGDPKLGPVQDNGGPTWTMALLPGSPAIGTAINAFCRSAEVSGLDQRGMSRPASCDIGAFQTGAIPAVPTSPSTIVPTAISTIVATASVSK
ncbi:MAG: choice-of-anchor Q domain-containing protein [Aggregatilineales bacterium]